MRGNRRYSGRHTTPRPRYSSVVLLLSLALVVSQSFGIIAANALDPSLGPGSFSAWGSNSPAVDSKDSRSLTGTFISDTTKVGTIDRQTAVGDRTESTEAALAPNPTGSFSLDFAAATPGTYDRKTGTGGAYNDGSNANVVEELEASDFDCGDFVVFFSAIEADGDVDPGTTLTLNYVFASVTTSNDLVGYVDLVSASLNSPDTWNADLDGNEIATITSEDHSETEITATIQITNLDPDEQYSLRLVAQLGCRPDPTIAGNVHARFDDGTGSDGSRVSGGAQTVPLKQAGEIGQPTLTITKAASSQSVGVGAAFSYTITVKNTGNAQATGVTITDDLADSLTGVSASFDVDPGTAGGTGPCTVGAGNTISCAVGTLAANNGAANGPDEVVVTINATAPNSCGDLTNTAQVDWTENAGDPVASNQVTVTVTGCAPTLTITKAASSQSVGVGAAFSYTITVKNTGNAQATGVTITDDLADSLTGVSASFDVDPGTAGGTGPCTVGAGNTISCAVGTLAANNGAANGPDEVVVTINATAPTGSCPTLTNTATVDSDQTSPQTSNQVTVTVTGCAPGLEITKAASSTQVPFGSSFSYTITVKNTGNTQATGVTITDDLADSLTGVSATFDKDPGSGTDGTCTVGASTNTISCAVGILAANDNAANGPDEVKVTINATAPRDSCPTLTNTATVDSDQTEPQTSNQVTVTVTGCAPGLEITKAASSTQVPFGTSFSYTITVANTGNAQATGVTVSDNLADSLTGVSATFDIDPGTAGGTGNCDIGAGNTVTCPGAGQGSITLAASDGNTTGPEPDVVKVTINATAPNTCGELSNTATVDSDQTSPQTSNQVTVTVTGCAPGLEITKAASSTQVPFGTSFSYTITVANTGNAAANGVIVTDNLNDSLTNVSASFDGGESICNVGNNPSNSSDKNFVTCNIGTVGAGSSVIITITANAPVGQCPTITNQASFVTEGGEGPGGSSNIVTTTVTGCIPPPPSPIGINIDKSGPALAHVGDTVTYTFAVTLTTSTPLSNITVTDPICSATPTLVSKTGGDQDTTLEPGETWNFSCTHVVTASDPDPLPNTATVTGTAPDGRNTSDTDSHQVDIIHPAIQIVKTARPDSVSPGGTVTYTFKVTNTGDVKLFDVKVTDNKLGDICTIAQLDVGETQTCTATFTAPQLGGPVDNVGVAEGEDVTGFSVRDQDNASVDVVLGVTVTPTRTPPGGVAFTGAGGVIPLAGLALLLLLAGSGILFLTRRREDGTEA